MIEKIKDLVRPIKYKIETIRLIWPFFNYISKNLASFGISKSKDKSRALILMQVHIVEKGLSLSSVKPWFGQPKILSLISHIEDYFEKYKDKDLLFLVTSTLRSYFDFNESNDNPPQELIERFQRLNSLLGDYSNNSLNGGYVSVDNGPSQLVEFDFASFAASRHSVRSFTGESIDIVKICNALKIAETTPSACNRQPWFNYVITNRATIFDILSTQQGSRQFKEQVSAVIITTSSANFFFGDEYNQMFFNTGLYSMNLLYALHSEGLGTIPLNLGIGDDRIDHIRKICGINKKEMPISLIAVGVLPEHYKYACSPRFSYSDYTKFDIVL